MPSHALADPLKLGSLLLCSLMLFTGAGCGDGSTASSSSGGSTPRISGSPATQVQVGQPYSFTPSATDAGAPGLSFSIAHKPSWATFSVATGQLTGIPTSNEVGTYSHIVISASNGISRASLPAFGITVTQGGEVTLAWAPPTTNTNGTPVTELAGYLIAYGTNSSALNQSVNIGSSVATTYTVQHLSAGTWYFAIAAYTVAGVHSAFSSPISKTIP